MASALEQFLGSIRSGSQALGGVQEMRQQEQEQAKLQDLGSRFEGLMQSGQGGQVAGDLLASGDPTLARQMLMQQMKAEQAGPALPSLSAQELMQAYQLPETQAKALEGLDRDKQLREARGMAGIGLSRQSQKRLQREETQKQRRDLKDISKMEKKYIEDENKIKTATKLIKQNNALTDNATVFFLARQIQGGGVLSEADVNAFKARVGENVFNELSNYLTGETQGTLNANQRKAINGLVDTLTTKIRDERDQQIGTALENAIIDNPKLVKDGKLDPSIKKRADRYGFKVQIDEDGLPIISKKLKKTREVQGATEGASNVEQELSKIKDQALKSRVSELIKNRTEEQARIIIQNALKIQGGQ